MHLTPQGFQIHVMKKDRLVFNDPILVSPTSIRIHMFISAGDKQEWKHGNSFNSYLNRNYYIKITNITVHPLNECCFLNNEFNSLQHYTN